MNKRRLISLDLDGTLLDPDYHISELTISLLRRLEQDGDIIFLNSGRPVRTLEKYHNLIGLSSPYCAYAGKFVGRLNSPCLPHFDPCFHKKDILPVLKGIENKIQFFMAENHFHQVQNKSNPFLDKYFPPEGIDSKMVNSLDEIIDDIKIMVIESDADILDYLENGLADVPIHVHPWKEKNYYEFVVDGLDKGTAVSLAASTYGIERNDIYAFGDSPNDFPMLEAAGHPFAMLGCKSSKLAAAFPATKKGNAEDGVAYQLLLELGD